MDNPLPLHPIWIQAAATAVCEFGYGDIIPHAWIYAHLEIEEPKGPITAEKHRTLAFDLLRKMDGFRDAMLEKHLCYLINVRGVGYKVIEPPYQTSAAMLRLQRELSKSLSAAMSALVHVNDTHLSLEDARENSEAKAKLAWLKTVGRKQLESRKKGIEDPAEDEPGPPAGEEPST
jgi:hypothetical protein